MNNDKIKQIIMVVDVELDFFPEILTPGLKAYAPLIMQSTPITGIGIVAIRDTSDPTVFDFLKTCDCDTIIEF
jgi:hypothetical protein